MSEGLATILNMTDQQDAAHGVGEPTTGWPPVDPQFVQKFQARGQNYTKATPSADPVLVVDFFAGAGGMTCGFTQTRQSGLVFQHVGAFDIDRQALETLRINNSVPTFEKDVRELAEQPTRLTELIPEIAQSESRPPLVFVGCPPCQGFSAHRKKDHRDDARNSLVDSFASIVIEFMPDAIVMENVPEIFSGRYSKYYKAAARRLKSAGYSLSEAIVDASEYGVPQRRRRALVLGALSGTIEVPDPVVSSKEVRTVRDAIGHLPHLLSGQTDPLDPWHRAPKHTPRILEKISRIPEDGGDRRDLEVEDQLACHSGIDETATRGFTDVYGRLRWDRPSVTITAKSSTPSCGRFLHPTQNRNISVREAALLQSFPHNYVFTGGLVNQYRQIGEAVPPLLARHLANAVLDHIRPRGTRHLEVWNRINHTVTGVSKPNSEVVSVDLFCGAGGLSLGMEAAGLTSVYAADINPAAIATFQKNLGIHAEVRDAYDDAIGQTISERVGDRPFVVVGGPPCQGFSQQRRGDDIDARNQLVLRHLEIATTLKQLPEAIVLENVMYLDSPRGRTILSRYLDGLKSAGYVYRRYDINSAEYGLAQTRKRIVVVAIKDEYKAPIAPLPTTTKDRWFTIGEALAGLSSATLEGPANHVASKEKPINVQRMAYVDMGRGRTAIPVDLQMKCHQGYNGHLDVYGRLDWFEYARTITGGFDSSSRGEYTHPFKNRSITAREAARLQGFPDGFEFLGNKSEVRHQIGNAVPAPLGYAIGRALACTLGLE